MLVKFGNGHFYYRRLYKDTHIPQKNCTFESSHYLIMLTESFQKLYIQVSLQQFSYCIKNQVNNQVVQFKSFPLDPYKTIEQQLDVFFDKEEDLRNVFQDVL